MFAIPGIPRVNLNKSALRKALGHSLIAAPMLLAPVLASGCETSTQRGAGGGAAAGAAVGALIGAGSGDAAEGALIGGALGAGVGAAAGNAVGHRRKERELERQVEQNRKVRGHYENRIVRSPSGETYEERVWVPDAR